MDKEQKRLLKDLATGLMQAAIAARRLATYEPETITQTITIRLDEASVAQAVSKAIRDNFEV